MPNLDRLTRLANLVEREILRGNQFEFDLTEWGCGTTACAIGLATATRAFNKEGFIATSRFNEYCPMFYKDDEIVHGWDAVSAFFGITLDTANDLFSSYSYPGGFSGRGAAEEVVRCIRKFVADNSQVIEAPVVVAEKELEPA